MNDNCKNIGNQKILETEITGKIRNLPHLIKMLQGRDKAMMQAYIESGFSPSTIASIAEVKSYTISRRIEKITERLDRGAISLFFKHRKNFDPMERRILRLYFKDGLKKMQIIRNYGFSKYKVYKAINKLKFIKQINSEN